MNIVPLPNDLPAPPDDGAADHLPGKAMPAIELAGSDGRQWRLDQLSSRSVVFIYPSIGGPDTEDLLAEWTAVPGARGCTPEACSFRDGLGEFGDLRTAVFGLSTQPSAEQANHARELGLSYPLLCDESLLLADDPGLPTFEFHGQHFYKRLTLIVGDGIIEDALYPVFPPERAAEQTLTWLAENQPT